jgi:hypothetical protein
MQHDDHHQHAVIQTSALACTVHHHSTQRVHHSFSLAASILQIKMLSSIK